MSAADIADRVSGTGAAHRLRTPGLGDGSPVLRGSFVLEEVRPGLTLHATDAQELHDAVFETQAQASLRLLLLLEGELDVAFGGQALQLRAEAARPAAALVSLSEPDLLERRIRSGSRARKVTLTLAPDWLQASGLGAHRGARELASRHLSVRRWQPHSRAAALASTLVQPGGLDTSLHRLFLESRATELLLEVFSHWGSPPPPPALPARTQRQLARALELLRSAPAQPLTLSQLAREAGTNPTTLQQWFRQAFGTSVFGWLREHRLQLAHEALAHDACSVAEAARLAGYGSAANFATAYRRRFGLAPSAARGPACGGKVRSQRTE